MQLTLLEYNNYSATASQDSDTDISKLKCKRYLGRRSSVFGPNMLLKFFQNMRMSEKCRNNNNSDYPLTSRRTGGGKKNKFPVVFGRSRSKTHILYTEQQYKQRRTIKITQHQILIIFRRPNNNTHINSEQSIYNSCNWKFESEDWEQTKIKSTKITNSLKVECKKNLLLAVALRTTDTFFTTSITHRLLTP